MSTDQNDVLRKLAEERDIQDAEVLYGCVGMLGHFRGVKRIAKMFRAIRNKAWNEAIEAAADIADNQGRYSLPGWTSLCVAEEIRDCVLALKRESK